MGTQNRSGLGLAAVMIGTLCLVMSGAERAEAWPPNNETDAPFELDYCNLQFPTSMNVLTSQVTSTIYGQVFEAGVTETDGPSPSVLVELGWGPQGTNPWDPIWCWHPASYNLQVSNNDEYMGTLIAPGEPGVYSYTFRYSIDGGVTGTYADGDGAGSNAGLVFSTEMLGVMFVAAGGACCVASVGNTDCDCQQSVDIGHLTTLIDNLFINFTPLCCVGEANCDGDPMNNVDIGDLTALIDNLFISFTPLPACQ